MSRNPDRGRVYRRCGCRDADGRQLEAGCPALAQRRHGRWAFAVDLPTLDRRRKTLRRGGFATQAADRSALHRVLACERAGVHSDDRQTVAEYLAAWIEHKAHTLKPTTMARYRDYITKDLSPALGAIRLEELTHHHVAAGVAEQLAAGRGPVTVHRCVATLSSALGDAVRQHRLLHNPARFANVPRPRRQDRVCWSPAQAVKFLWHCTAVGDPLTELFELIVCTGLRKGEALALHWADIDLDSRLLFVRWTLSNVNNTTPVFTAPKTRSSHAWIGLSDRAVAALRRQAERQQRQQIAAGVAWRDHDLVFTRRNGRPLRPEYVLRRLHTLTAEAGLPRIRVHDLRHFAATTMLSSQVPLAMASKAMRHSTLSTTTEVYGHLLRHVAHQAVDAIDTALGLAERGLPDSGDLLATTAATP
jgi:integrase